MGKKWPHEISEKGQLIVRSPSLTSDVFVGRFSDVSWNDLTTD